MINRQHDISILKHFGLPSPIIFLLIVGLSPTLFTPRADAIPAFARAYRLACNTCHASSYPQLNSFGRNFKENGYQLPKGATSRFATLGASAAQPPFAKRLALLEQVPLAFRMRGTLQSEQADTTNVNFATPAQVDLLSGGPLFQHASYFIKFGIFTNGSVSAPEVAVIQFHNIGGEGLANLRIGKFNLLDFQFPNHRLPTMSVSPVGTVGVGLNPFVLDTHHTGIDLYGRPRSGPIFYEIALVNGTSPVETEAAAGGHGGAGEHGAVSGTDSDSFKDIFVRLTYTLPSQRYAIGVLGYFGKTALLTGTTLEHQPGETTDMPGHAAAPVSEDDPLTDEQNGINDGFRILGADIELSLWRCNVRGALLFGTHDNPYGDGVRFNYQGVMGHISYPIRRELLAAVRYDRVFSSDLPTLERQFLTPYMRYLLLENVHLGVEYNINLDDFDASRANLIVDLAF